MKQRFPKNQVTNPLAILRKAGYFHFLDPISNEESFVLRLSADRYPRMHLYVEEHGSDWSFNLHIDQKKPSYKGTSKHAGEYEGPVVEREMERLVKWVAAETGYNATEKPAYSPPKTEPDSPKSPSLFHGIF